jgi:hypothetical protein
LPHKHLPQVEIQCKVHVDFGNGAYARNMECNSHVDRSFSVFRPQPLIILCCINKTVQNLNEVRLLSYGKWRILYWPWIYKHVLNISHENAQTNIEFVVSWKRLDVFRIIVYQNWLEVRKLLAWHNYFLVKIIAVCWRTRGI